SVEVFISYAAGGRLGYAGPDADRLDIGVRGDLAADAHVGDLDRAPRMREIDELGALDQRLSTAVGELVQRQVGRGRGEHAQPGGAGIDQDIVDGDAIGGARRLAYSHRDIGKIDRAERTVDADRHHIVAGRDAVVGERRSFAPTATSPAPAPAP